MWGVGGQVSVEDQDDLLEELGDPAASFDELAPCRLEAPWGLFADAHLRVELDDIVSVDEEFHVLEDIQVVADAVYLLHPCRDGDKFVKGLEFTRLPGSLKRPGDKVAPALDHLQNLLALAAREDSAPKPRVQKGLRLLERVKCGGIALRKLLQVADNPGKDPHQRVLALVHIVAQTLADLLQA